MEISDPVSSILEHKSIQNIWHITPDASVLDAIQLMADKNIGALLVMDGERLVGIVSERDYTRNVVLKGRSSKDTSVAEIMIESVVCVPTGTQTGACLQLMTKKHIRHLPVVGEDEKVVGVVSIGDLVKRVISAQDAMIDQLESYIAGGYPG